MARVSIAKALKLKNRLVGRLGKTQTDISQNNSRFIGTPEKVDVAELLAVREELVTAIIDLKTAVGRANNGAIDRDIRQLGEHKATLAWLKTIDTQDGKVPNSYAEKDLEYTAVLKQASVDKRCKELESLIDELQDKLDEFNVITTIELSDQTLALAS